jgi:tRNA A58 N-methylase Trm61
MIKLFYALAVAVLAAPSVVTFAATANDTMVVADDEVGRIVMLRNVSIQNGDVSGEIVNNSSDTLRDVVLEIRYSWRWADEFHPGKDDPGQTVYYTAAKEIPPRGSARFDYKPSPPLPIRRDGSFVIDVKVAGFERVYF